MLTEISQRKTNALSHLYVKSKKKKKAQIQRIGDSQVGVEG